MTMYNDWFKWNYEGVEYSSKPSATSKINVSIFNYATNFSSFQRELYNSVEELQSNSRSILLTAYPVNYAILKSYYDLKIPLKVYIPQFGNFNREHVERAKKICDSHNMNYTLVDLNIEKFFEEQAEELQSKLFLLDVKKLPLVKLLETINDPVICTTREPLLVKDKMFDTEEGSWLLKITEEDMLLPSYFFKDKKVFSDFFFYRKELVSSYINDPLNILHSNYRGITSSMGVKMLMFENIWPGFTKDIDSSRDVLNVSSSFIDKFYHKTVKDKIAHSNPLYIDALNFIQSCPQPSA